MILQALSVIAAEVRKIPFDSMAKDRCIHLSDAHFVAQVGAATSAASQRSQPANGWKPRKWLEV